MKNKEFVSNNKKETWEIARNLIEGLKEANLVILKGELGSGKTTFAQGVLNFLGAKGPFTSPTFVVMKKYEINSGNYKAIYHLDCYRVEASDVLDLGWEEIVEDKENLVLVEWPEKIKSILPKSCLQLNFKSSGENERKIRISKI